MNLSGLTEKHLDQTNTFLHPKPHYLKWWHAIACYIATAILWVLGKDFVHDYWTTLGDIIYRPPGKDVGREDIVCHELAHRYDDLEHGWKYRLSYIFSWKMRAKWEYRAYSIQLLAIYREYGFIPYATIKKKAKQVSGAAYLWAGNKKEAEEIFLTVKKNAKQLKDMYDPNEGLGEIHPKLKV